MNLLHDHESWLRLIYVHKTQNTASWYSLIYTECSYLPIIMWAFHPILVTSFLVVFGNKVTRILCNSFCIFHLVLPILASEQKTYRKSHNLRDEKPNTKLSKYEMSRALVGRMFLFVTWKTMVKVDFFSYIIVWKTAGRMDFFLKKNKQTYSFIGQIRVIIKSSN